MLSESPELYGDLGVICLLRLLHHIKGEDPEDEFDWDSVEFQGMYVSLILRLFNS
jgi:hypothetical protein